MWAVWKSINLNPTIGLRHFFSNVNVEIGSTIERKHHRVHCHTFVVGECYLGVEWFAQETFTRYVDRDFRRTSGSIRRWGWPGGGPHAIRRWKLRTFANFVDGDGLESGLGKDCDHGSDVDASNHDQWSRCNANLVHFRFRIRFILFARQTVGFDKRFQFRFSFFICWSKSSQYLYTIGYGP